jgi:hypothetical protein
VVLVEGGEQRLRSGSKLKLEGRGITVGSGGGFAEERSRMTPRF